MRITIIVLLILSSAAQAEAVRYTYTGADTATFTGEHAILSLGNPPIVSPTPVPEDFQLSAWIEIDGGLDANLNNADISGLISSWSMDHIFDTILPIDDFNSDGACPPEVCFFNVSVSTDASANITEWDLNLFAELPGIGFTETETVTYSSAYSTAPGAMNGEEAKRVLFDSFYGRGDSDTITSNAVGAWSATVVPVPAAAWLFGSGLTLLGWLRRKPTV